MCASVMAAGTAAGCWRIIKTLGHKMVHLQPVNGFAAETRELITYARAKLAAKRLDLLVANDVSRPDSGFGAETNKVYIFHATGAVEDLPVMPKTGVAAAIWDRIVPLLSTK